MGSIVPSLSAQEAKLEKRFEDVGLVRSEYDITIRRTDRPLYVNPQGLGTTQRVDYDYIFNNMVFRSIGSIIKYITKKETPPSSIVRCKVCPLCQGHVPNACHKCTTAGCNHDFGIAIVPINVTPTSSIMTQTTATITAHAVMTMDEDIEDIIREVFKERVCYILNKKKKQRIDGEWKVTPIQAYSYYKAVLEKAKVEKDKMIELYTTI